ncbi:hypothetical protein OH807_25095 [Kitasatospora sp. NBC_01560]|uniref:hypothetical protein n=1 Tax=Kitasatospora sp. NBC_01560 TaxID=2975965 RepID=UPI003867711D
MQDRRLSYTARGLLADLLSRPDGWREDGRQMADTSPQGRGAVRRALKELTDAGYYRVDRIRLPDGTIRSEAHVFDTPQPGPPGIARPGAGEAKAGRRGAPPVKEREQEPTLPAAAPVERPDPPEHVRTAVAALFRAIHPEPRLRPGGAEALALAPLVAEWLERGSSAADLARALLPGLPPTVHSPVGVLRDRLTRKLPPARAPEQRAAPRYAECGRCHDPVPEPGICRPCAGLATRESAGAEVGAATGAERARAALRSVRAATA